MALHPRLVLVCQLQRRVYAVIVEPLQRTASYPPHVGEVEELQRAAPLVVAVYAAHAVVAAILLGKLAAHLGEGLGGGYAHAHGYVGPQAYAPGYVAHHLRQVVVALISSEVAEALVDAVVLDAHDALPQYVGHPLAHGGVELHVGREHSDLVALHDVAHLEERVAAAQSHGLGFGRERHDAAVVARQHAHGSSLESWVEHLLYRTEEAVAIYQCPHIVSLWAGG